MKDFRDVEITVGASVVWCTRQSSSMGLNEGIVRAFGKREVFGYVDARKGYGHKIIGFPMFLSGIGLVWCIELADIGRSGHRIQIHNWSENDGSRHRSIPNQKRCRVRYARSP